jgi:hypothetical protein
MAGKGRTHHFRLAYVALNHRQSLTHAELLRRANKGGHAVVTLKSLVYKFPPNAAGGAENEETHRCPTVCHGR